MKWEKNIKLANYSTFRLGGKAKYFACVSNEEDIKEAVEKANEMKVPYYIFGGGSNIIFPDDGYPGVIIRMENRSVEFSDKSVMVGSGVSLQQLIVSMVKKGFCGMEELVGIPGTVGGAICGNAGTGRVEIKDVIESVDVLCFEKKQWVDKTMLAHECKFSYRDSIFKKHKDWIIVRAIFPLNACHGNAGLQVIKESINKRIKAQPYNIFSGGSIFKNPGDGVFAGELIDKAGLKGTKIGDAEISTKHGNFIINNGSATAKDVLALISLVQDKIKNEFGVELEKEIIVVK
jgi:UDP-N-acetylmuramate dehydrogenase